MTVTGKQYYGRHLLWDTWLRRKEKLYLYSVLWYSFCFPFEPQEFSPHKHEISLHPTSISRIQRGWLIFLNCTLAGNCWSTISPSRTVLWSSKYSPCTPIQQTFLKKKTEKCNRHLSSGSSFDLALVLLTSPANKCCYILLSCYSHWHNDWSQGMSCGGMEWERNLAHSFGSQLF